LHVLTRAELYRFGIDTRPLPETAWTLEAAQRPYIRKIAAAKQGDGASFRTLEWRLFCENKERARLMFVRESDQAGGGPKTMMLMAGSDKSVAFGKYPAHVGKYEVWSDIVSPDAMQAMLAAPSLQMGEGTLGAEGKTKLATFDIDTLGLGTSWTQLLSSCPANTARPAATSSSLNAAPAIPATSAAPATPAK
jgi:hypothetical protein